MVIVSLIVMALFGLGITPGSAQEVPTAEASLDLDGSGYVDSKDLYLFMTFWKTSDTVADFNRDGKIDASDLLLFAESFHTVIVPTPTPTPEEITPTPTPEEVTPTPSPSEETPTPGAETPTPAEETPTPGEETPTPIIVEPTPTPTLEEGTPIPTPEESTPTSTPTPGEAPPTATPTSTPTATPTVDPGATPTPTPVGLFFYTNFDTVDTLEEAGLSTLNAEDEEELIEEGRMPELNELVPWFVLNTEELDPDFEYGVALSNPKSAAINEDHFAYMGGQTSVLQVANPIDTSQAVDPVLSFDAAYLFEMPLSGDQIRDFLILEVKREDSTQVETLDINGDGVITLDNTAYDQENPQALFPGTFDGLFGASNPNNSEGPLTPNDFVYVEVKLPADPALQIFFRFESDTSINAEGIYLDNIRVYDAAAGPGSYPTIRRIYNPNGTDIYVDTENPVVIQGNHMTPAKKVIFTSRDGEQELAFTESTEGLSVVLPRISNPLFDDTTATLKVVRSDDAESGAFNFTLKAAPVPVIESISPAPFFLGASDSTLLIQGNHFRPAFSGATESGGSIVSIDTGSGEPIRIALPSEILSRSLTEISVDATPLKSLSPGSVSITVINEYSGQVSNAVDLVLQSGSGDLQVDGFTIEVGGGYHYYDPLLESYSLQQDQIFSLLWDVAGVVSDQLNIDLAGIPFVQNGQINTTVISERLKELGRESESPNTKASVYVGFTGVSLQIAPMILGVTGTITASIRIGNGVPVETTFALYDPMPPLLYERSDDWANAQYSTSKEIDFTVVGDNFRGFTAFGTVGESVTRLQLIPQDGSDPINLPVMDAYDLWLDLFIGDPDYADSLYQLIPTNFYNFNEGQRLWVPEGETKEFTLRVLNPDSGLYVDSTPRTIQFIP